MPLVTIAMYEGRTLDQKRELVKGVTDVVARVTGNESNPPVSMFDQVSNSLVDPLSVIKNDRRSIFTLGDEKDRATFCYHLLNVG